MIRVAKRLIRSLHATRERRLESLLGNPEAARDMGLPAYLALRVRLKAEIAELYEMIREGFEVVPPQAQAPGVDPTAPVIGEPWATPLGDRVLTVSYVGPDRIGVTEPDGEERNIHRRIFARDHRRQ